MFILSVLYVSCKHHFLKEISSVGTVFSVFFAGILVSKQHLHGLLRP